jgi:hypothetical protein
VVDDDGNEIELAVCEPTDHCAFIKQQKAKAMQIRMKLGELERDFILDSECGPSIIPWELWYDVRDTCALRPSDLKLSAANGKSLGIAGVANVRITLPGTNEAMMHEVQVTVPGTMPRTVLLAGNDLWKRCGAKLDWIDENVSGRTPHGENFVIPVKFSRTEQAAAVQEEGRPTHLQEGAIAMKAAETMVLEPGEQRRMEAISTGQRKEGKVEWTPMQFRQAVGECDQGNEDDFESITPIVRGVTEMDGQGKIIYWLMNPSKNELVIPRGATVGWVEECEVKSVEEMIGEEAPAPKGAKLKACEWWAQRPGLQLIAVVLTYLVTEKAAVVLSVVGMYHVCLCSLVLWNQGGEAAADQVCSVHLDQPEVQEDGKSRATTTRHKARAGLATSDLRRAESGDQTVARVKEQLKQKQELEKHRKWLKRVSSTFGFGEELEAKEIEELNLLLYAYKEIFAENPKAPPLIDGIEHALYFRHNDPVPVRKKIPRLSAEQIEVMEKETKQMLKNHIIQFSDSEWATVPVFVRKKDGGWRYAISYIGLNDCILGDAQAIPNIPETLDALSKAKRFSAFDACAGFWAVRMRPKDRQYTAFHAKLDGSWHLFEFLRMPFGLKAATATYQRMFTRIMGKTQCTCSAGDQAMPEDHSLQCRRDTEGLINKICKIFVDDGIVYSEQEENHINDLAKIFKRLLANNVKLKASKCMWGTAELPVLGHTVIAGKGIRADPKKVEAILKVSAPQTAAALKTFLGSSGYLSKFIEHYAEMVEPLRDISALFQRKSERSIEHLWNDRAQAAFESVKVALAEAAVLHFPDFDAPFVILVDSSRKGMGCTLAQVADDGTEVPIAYASASLSKCQKNYGITDLEGCGVVWACRTFSHYITSGTHIVVTDHSSLKSLVEPGKEFSNGRLARYALELSQYDLVIAHRSGELLHAPDFLSRAEMGVTGEELEGLMEKVFGDTAKLALSVEQGMRKQLLSKKMKQRRLKRAITGAEIRQGIKEKQVVSVHDMVRMIKEGVRLPAEKCMMEDEEQSRVFDLYDMVCTVDAEECEQTGSEPLCEEAVHKAQCLDPFCTAMVRMLKSEGNESPIARKAMNKKEKAVHAECRRWLPHLEVRGGMLYRVKTGSVRSKKVIGDHDLLQLWVPRGELRQRLVKAVHGMLGHAGRDKTFQMMHDKFYWPGMYTAVEKHCSLCMNCQLHAPKPAAAPMQGHVEADKPGDYAAMDILHMEEVNGYKFLLTVIDVHSRYGMAIPLEEITAAAVQRAVEDWVVPGGFGRCRKWLIDGGSEFKGEMEEALEAWNSGVHVSAAEHYESHGIIEKYNRSLVNKIAKLLYDTKDGTWMEVRAAAVEGYNCSFHTAISSSEKMVAPMELWHGRNTVSDTMDNWAMYKEDECNRIC